MSTIDSVSRELGSLNATVEHQGERLDKMDDKLDRIVEKLAVIDHMRNNIAMMKKPVEDYQRVKQKGLGMWAMLTFLAGLATIIFNVISYIVRVGLLKIGT